MAKRTLKTFGVNTARYLKYVWLFCKVMHERGNFTFSVSVDHNLPDDFQSYRIV